MDSAWFQGFVDRCRQRGSLASVKEWVAAHAQPAPAVASKAAAHSTGRLGVTPRSVQISPRNDVRTSAVASGAGVDLSFPPASSSPSDYNIFADITLHDQAAATIASASQELSGFTADMALDEGVVLDKFRAYLNDFIAPHWLMTFYRQQEAVHDSDNHSQFVRDLVSIVTEGLRAVGAGDEDIARAEESVQSLSQRLSGSNSQEEQLTLFSSFWIQRPNSTDPVNYGIFYTTVEARYTPNGKTEVLSTSVNTYSVIFSLNSGVLIEYEEDYNALLTRSVGDWLSAHNI